KKASSAPYKSPYLHDLPDGMLAVAIALKNDAANLSGKLRAEDIISVFASPNQVEDSTSYSAKAFAELKYLRVLAVSDAQNHEIQKEETDLAEKKEDVSTIILMANQAQAELLAGLNNNSTIHTALVVRGNKEKADKFLAEQEEYLKSAHAQSANTNETEE
ncbi:MAG: RcpC/CpaB family pilus assembly protein, partial [Christensenella sp.]